MDVRTGIKPPETTAVSPMGLAVLPEGKAIALSPLNKRRWENFKVNRRGYWALWIFLTMFVVSLFAEFIANDKPIFIYVNGQVSFSRLSAPIRTQPLPRSRTRTCSALQRIFVMIT